MTAFASTHRGDRVALYDSDRERWLPPLLLLEDPRPCESGCCDAYAIRSTSGMPVKLHAYSAAEVRIVPKPRVAPAANKAAPEHDAETGQK